MTCNSPYTIVTGLQLNHHQPLLQGIDIPNQWFTSISLIRWKGQSPTSDALAGHPRWLGLHQRTDPCLVKTLHRQIRHRQ